ncbi:hypothetical protein DAPPUDRAFT_111184 [Daphnia pulex]|uniref:DUF4806 domain-containing protein n=1 Tax=Daphnia pulex TaxID=6669 RepID=E9H8G4_DAPPU|nr:hypothetical protein DAPPUDRAFT_111184 [Daphnia pulex]|eukprot:EFX71984.1 hypothetical protein DAPPUDRAFT_111184 [Daphnia pulex]
MFDASPSQPQPSPSDDDAYAQPIQSRNSRDSSSDPSKEYLPQKHNREDDDGMGDEEASDEKDLDWSSGMMKTSRVKLLPSMSQVLRRQENTMRHLKLLDQKMEGIKRKLTGVHNAGPSESEYVARLLSKLPLNSADEMTEFLEEINDAIADKSITIGYLKTHDKYILKAVVSLELARKLTYFGVKPKDGDGDRLAFSTTYICNELLEKSVRENFPNSELDEKFFQKHISNWLNGTSNVSDCDRENVNAVFVDFVNTSCCEVDNEQDYGKSDDSGENEDDLGENEDDELSEMESSFEDCGEFTEEEESLENRVAAIAIKHRLSGAVVRSITNLLINLGNKIYKDRRTILKTPRTKLGSTSFKHFGLIEGLDRKLKSGLLICSAGAELQISIDGLPLCKSRPTVFWPILCRVKNANDSSPFPVSIHCGNGRKRPDLNLYLEPLIEELKHIEINGIKIMGKLYCCNH